jgi:hypothetical protein
MKQSLINFLSNKGINTEELKDDIPDKITSEGTFLWYRNQENIQTVQDPDYEIDSDEEENNRFSRGKPTRQIMIVYEDEHEEDDENEFCPSKILHRENGPAVIKMNGTKKWFRNNLLHREDGPAIETPDGYKYYYRNHKRHRIDGPAIIRPNGSYEWWFENKRHRNDENGPSVKTEEGSEYYYKNDIQHRVNGPAVKLYDPVINQFYYEWRYEGKFHRENGPAIIEKVFKYYVWYNHGIIQRIKQTNKYNIYFKDGIIHSPNDYPAIVIKTINEFERFKQTYSVLKDKTFKGGFVAWLDNGIFDRKNDLPAIVYGNGDKEWYSNGVLDRKDKPAILYSNGKEEFYENGIKKEPHYSNSIQNTKITKKLPKDLYMEILSFIC